MSDEKAVRPATTPSLRNNFTAGFLSDAYGVAASLVATLLTARALGPSGRGYYASVVLLSVLFTQLFDAGLGEATIVLPARGRSSYPAAVAATMAVIIPLGIVGAVACVLTGVVTLDVVTANEWTALALAGVLVLFNACSNTLAWFLVSREKLVLVASMTAVSTTVITASIWGFVAVLDLQAAGAVLASVVGAVVVLAALLWFLPREGVSLKPAWDGRYLASAVRFGTTIQFSNLLVQIAGRLDLLVVYQIAGAASAGMYSVALALGALVGIVPIAISYASFPRLPTLTEEEHRALTASLFRAGIAAAITCSIGLGVLVPVAIPFLFGSAYNGAIGPALVLLPAGVLWSGQWILCRAAAAREFPKPLLISFAASVGVMVVLDLLLVGPFGTLGAAMAALISSGVGLVIAVAYLLRSGWPWRPFVPSVGDWVLLVATVRQMVTSVRRRATAPVGSPLPPSPPEE